MIDHTTRWFQRATTLVVLSDIVATLIALGIVLAYHLYPLLVLILTLNWGFIGMGICLILWFYQERRGKEKAGNRPI